MQPVYLCVAKVWSYEARIIFVDKVWPSEAFILGCG